MNRLQVSLFGKFCVRCNGQPVEGLDACKVQELFSYLLLYANRPHHRETLANLLWQEQAPAQSKSYLRRTLWQLQNAFKEENAANDILHVEPDWIQLDHSTCLGVDVTLFEQAFTCVQGKSGSCLDETAVQTLTEAVQVYRGDLLEGWYQDWCLFERERFQQMLLLMLDKLMGYCEEFGAYETGITYGMQILRYDLARERTHRRLMRLYYLNGDRTGALRQYERCVDVLHDELGVKPALLTEQLHHQIQADSLQGGSPQQSLHERTPTLKDTLQRLQQFDAILGQTRQQVQLEIQHVTTALNNQITA